MDLYERMRLLRSEKGLNRRELAAQLKMPYGTLSKYESGEREPGIDFISEIAQFYGVTTDYLVGLTDDPHGVFTVEVTDYDPQIKAITDMCQKINAQGLEYVWRFCEITAGNPQYQKKTLFD